MATTRSAARPVTRYTPSPSRTTENPSSAGRSNANVSGSGSSARVSSISEPSVPRKRSRPWRVTAEIVRTSSRSSCSVATSALLATTTRGRVEQLRSVLLELFEQHPFLLLGRTTVEGSEVEQDHEHAGALDVAQERVAQALALGRTLDEARDVGEHELMVLEAHDTEVRFERGERVVRDLRLRRAHRRDERGLARVREADQRGVGEQLHLEAQPVLLAVLALLSEARRATRVRQEARVAAAPLPALGREVAVAVTHEVGEQLAVTVTHARALGDGHLEVGPLCTMALLTTAVGARRRTTVRVVAKREQRRGVAIGTQIDVAARAAVAAAGTAFGDVRFTPERDSARATIAAAQVDLHLVDEVPGNHQVRLRTDREEDGRKPPRRASPLATGTQEFSEPGPERPDAEGVKRGEQASRAEIRCVIRRGPRRRACGRRGDRT